MSQTTHQEPWERLEAIIRAQRTEELGPFLHELPPGEQARTLSRLTDADREALLRLIGPHESAEVLEHLSDTQAAEIIEELPADQAAAIVDELPSDERVDVLGELDTADADAILREMEPEEANETRELLQFVPDTAGGLMITEYLAYPRTSTVSGVVEDLRRFGERYSDYDIQYAYITDETKTLVGVLRLRDLLLSPGDRRLDEIMLPNPLRLRTDDSLEKLEVLFDEHAFFGMPVVADGGQLVGVVRREAVEEALGEQATETYLKMSGLFGEEELRTMPIFRRSSRRLAWLSINIVLNVFAASVIALYQDTLTAVIALAVFLPIISDMSGCSGNQAVAVSIRELTLGLVKPYEFLRVVVKEGAVGIINGLALGILLGLVAVAWKGNWFLGLVVGGALTLNTVVSVFLGGVVPLALKRLNMDPAVASGPILTTVTDMCGFFLVLSLASAMLPLIV